MKKMLQLLGSLVIVAAVGAACATPTGGEPSERPGSLDATSAAATTAGPGGSTPVEEPVAEPVAEEPVADEPATGSGAVRVGEGVYTYDDGLTIEVVDLAPYVPGEYELGADAADAAVTFTVTITNGTGAPVDLGLTTVNVNAGTAGNAAEQILGGDLAFGFDGAVLPGKASSVRLAYAVASTDLGELVIEIEPGFLAYDAAYFEGGL